MAEQRCARHIAPNSDTPEGRWELYVLRRTCNGAMQTYVTWSHSQLRESPRMRKLAKPLPGWRNGIRGGLKILCP